MVLAIYLISAVLLLVAAFVIFRILVRRDYQLKGHLSPFTAFLELLIWILYICFPYIYNPADWVLVWFAHTPASPILKIIGSILVTGGMGIALVAMGVLGLHRTMGQQGKKLEQTWPYRVSRNPQLVGIGLVVMGIIIIWPSCYALGWGVLYFIIGHMMVLTEEEHLHWAYDQEYGRYCEQTPRYFSLFKPN
jgi:protein-S-isoprenylcysteine O-methyltransferase Ste14